MRHAIKTLQTEQTRIELQIGVGKRDGKPATWRPSEWAMHMGSLERQRQDVVNALNLLNAEVAKK